MLAWNWKTITHLCDTILSFVCHCLINTSDLALKKKKTHIVFFLLCKVNIESWRAYACQRITFSFLNRLREKTEQIAAMKWWQTLYKNADNHCKKNADKHCTKMLTNIGKKRCWQTLYKNADKHCTKILTNIVQIFFILLLLLTIYRSLQKESTWFT